MTESNNIKSKYEYQVIKEDIKNIDLTFKVLVIGNSGVGKSCISNKAVTNQFFPEYTSTIGFEYFNFKMKINNKIINLQIWDTCGQEIYKSIIKNYYKNSSLAILVYAINDIQSFDDINLWFKELRNNANPYIKIFLIGNKNDLEMERKINFNQGLDLSKSLNFDYFCEVSAKTGFNAENLFIKASLLLYEDYISNEFLFDNNNTNSKLNYFENSIDSKKVNNDKCC